LLFGAQDILVYKQWLFFQKKKIRCVGFDIDKKKVNTINSGKLPIKELKSWFGFDIKNSVRQKYLQATNDHNIFIDNSFNVHFIAIPTEKNGKPYFDILFNVLKKLVIIIKKKNKIKPVIIIESTLTPQCSEKKIIPFFKKYNLVPGKDFIYGVAPRRDWFVEGTKSLIDIDRVFGSTDPISSKIIKDILSIVCKNLHEASSHKVSEMVKSIENAYRHMEITLANQLSLAYPNENMREVLKLVGTKWNVGTYHPGFGTGGYCIPLSSQYVLKEVKDKSKLTLLRETIKTDTNINILIAKSLIKKGYKKIGVLGLSYKGNLKVDILSPVIPFIKYLKSKGKSVSLFDPYYSNKEITQITGVKSFKYPQDLSKFDCIVVSIDHKEFKTNMNNIIKYLTNCKYILDNMKVWEKINFPKHITYKISGEKNWI
jgi:nucleotide sugar dehydrogenase